MKFQKRGAISPIIATLLLIAIAVAASIIVYVFVNSLAGGLTQGGGQQTTERLQMQGYNFAASPSTGGSCTCSGQILQIFLLNSASSSSTISAIYFDGTLLTLTTQTTGAITLSAANDFVYTAPTLTELLDYTTTCSSVNGGTGQFCFSAATTNLTYAAGTTGQIVITFSSGGAPVAGTSHTVKVVSSTGATNVFSVSAGRTG
jgi:flagellin-like protein